MTFTKEKLAELELSLNKVKSGIKPELGFCLYAGSLSIAQDMQPLFEAATALPNYITALAEAERALTDIQDWIGSEVFDDDDRDLHDTTQEERAENISDDIREDLTTIRQLARGKE